MTLIDTSECIRLSAVLVKHLHNPSQDFTLTFQYGAARLKSRCTLVPLLDDV